MFKFDPLVRGDKIAREVQHPNAAPVPENVGDRLPCDGCEIGPTARKNGLETRGVAGALTGVSLRNQDRQRKYEQ